MTNPRGLFSALVVAPLFVVGLAACAGAEPAAMPEPTAMPTLAVTESTAAPTPPGSRVPLDCAQIFASLDGFVVSETPPMSFLDTGWGVPLLAQAGFMPCDVRGRLGSTDVGIQAVVGVDIPQRSVGTISVEAAQAADSTSSGLGFTYSNCTPEPVNGYCDAGAWADGYFVQYSITVRSTVAADFEQSYGLFADSLGARIASWDPPSAPWHIPEGALSRATGCEGEVGVTDAAVRAAMPFSLQSSTSVGNGEPLWLQAEAGRRAGVTSCVWNAAEGFVYIAIIPGAAWYFERPGVLYETPYEFPGAVATTVVSEDPSAVSLELAVDGSYVVVQVQDQTGVLDADAITASARAIAEAVVAEFGGP